MTSIRKLGARDLADAGGAVPLKVQCAARMRAHIPSAV
jgi:hypothetical protein